MTIKKIVSIVAVMLCSRRATEHPYSKEVLVRLLGGRWDEYDLIWESTSSVKNLELN